MVSTGDRRQCGQEKLPVPVLSCQLGQAGHLGAFEVEAFGSFLRRLIIIYTERPTGTLAADGIYGWSRLRNDS
jgi:hypothetical protein